MKSRLLPALGGPTRTTRGWPSGRSRSLSRRASRASSATGVVQLRRQGRAAQRIDVGLLGEIEVGFEMGDHVEQMVAQRDDRPGQPARELLEGRVELGGVARFDHAEHRLGPREVDPAGEERPERELARLGMARTSAQAVGQDQVHEGRRSRPGGSRPRPGPCRSGRRPEGQHHRQERPQTVDSQRARRDAGAPRSARPARRRA